MYPDTFACEPRLRRAASPSSSLEEEADWRKSVHVQLTASRISISFWRDTAEHERQLHAPILEGHYIIEVLLRNTIVDCFRNGRRITKGTGGFGGTQIAAPGEEIRCSFRRPVEAVHVFVPRSILVATYEELQQCSCPPDYHLSDPGFAPDTVMGKLGCTLLEATSLRSPFSGLYCESLGMAILARAMEFQNELSAAGLRQGLAPWRLKRAIEYIEDNVGEQISLTDLAERAGLSRMHFAAQFKLATGLSPHAYLTEKRLGAAKSLLAEGRLPIAQIAFAVGFHTQAHFTTVFHKATGLTPKRWREQASQAKR
ncbi:AraC family transcriptional regulator [Caballeronia arationis]|uniref:Transcriptional regulator, AraC family n=1 Tax=Caballeronia arationis TaxID=1777142 RepID=A0A7Z7N0H0_9BURK|nr:AraC family transcriptional regulator [Caballeronia arationis]SAL03897.1 AraC family transcriptional regulator [Caballeronia arationis]SOE51827.1 transcriptional regulator, AraC family [Caballeronia arationis]